MFFGHFGVAMAARPAAPKVPLGVALVAAGALDVLCGVFSLLGVERSDPAGSIVVPWSHGLLMSLLWSAAAFGLAALVSRKVRIAAAVGLLVFSHWVLDFISHPMGLGKPALPDLPLLLEGSPMVGLGLYRSLPAALATELGLFAGGILIYLRATRPTDAAGKWLVWLVPLFLAASAVPPMLSPSLDLLPTFLVLLLLPLGMLIERHRSARNPVGLQAPAVGAP